MLHIHLKPELITQVAETSDLNGDRINLVNCLNPICTSADRNAALAELKSNGIIGRLYVVLKC